MLQHSHLCRDVSIAIRMKNASSIPASVVPSLAATRRPGAGPWGRFCPEIDRRVETPEQKDVFIRWESYSVVPS